MRNIETIGSELRLPAALDRAARERGRPLSVSILHSNTSVRPGRRPDSMMPAARLDSTETTPALVISRAAQLSQPFAGSNFPHGESALAV
jgi:hypothetical protein